MNILDLMRRLFATVAKGGAHRYAVRDGHICKTCVFYKDTIRLKDINGWAVYHEMGFDLVEIRLSGSTSVLWYDYYGDLLNILRESGVPEGDWGQPKKL